MKDNSISLLRIIFTILIVLLHVGIGKGSYIAVEFFFVLSGFLLAKKAYDKPDTISIPGYIKNRFVRLYPMYLISMLIYLLSVEYVSDKSAFLINSFKAIPSFFKQLVMLFPFGEAPIFFLNLPAWYVAVLFYVSIVIYILISKINKRYILPILMIIAIGILGYYFVVEGHLDLSDTYRGIYLYDTYIPIGLDGLFRGIAEISLGVILYVVYDKSHTMISDRVLIILNITEAVLITGTVTLSFFVNHTRCDYLYLVVIMVCIYLAFLPHKCRLYNNKFVRYLAGLSYSMYLNHAVFAWVLLPDVITGMSGGIYIYIICVFGFSVIIDVLVRIIKLTTGRLR